jgi:hypothetical protein
MKTLGKRFVSIGVRIKNGSYQGTPSGVPARHSELNRGFSPTKTP